MRGHYIDESAVVLFSGGQDSTTCLYWALAKFKKVFPIAFKYGQRHDIELVFANTISKIVNCQLKEVDLPFLSGLVDSALIGRGDVNERHSRLKYLPASFVPNRNQLFLTIAHMYAQTINARHIVIGVCETDYSGYPDCRDIFIKELQVVTNLGSDSEIIFHTPLMQLDKAQTFVLAEALGCLTTIIRFSHTCYEGDHETRHDWGFGCGECSACRLRKNGWKKYVELR